MTTAAAAGHSGTKDFHQVQVQYSSRIISVHPDANNATDLGETAVSGSSNVIGVTNTTTDSGVERVIGNSSNINIKPHISKNRGCQPIKDQLMVLKPDTLLNDTGIFTVYCFVKEFIGASGTSAIAIDNKIEQAMDLVKSHLMIAVREEVEVLKEKISELMTKINQLEVENNLLKANMSQETLHQLQAQLQIAGSGTGGNLIAQQQQQITAPQQFQQLPAPPPVSQHQQPQSQQQQQQPQQQQQQQQMAPQAYTPGNTINGPMS